MDIQCDKCGSAMIEDSSFEIESYRCWNCGNRRYPGYPKRPGNIELCASCGEEFDRKFSNHILCDVRRESDKFVLGNRKRAKKRREMMEARHDSAV